MSIIRNFVDISEEEDKLFTEWAFGKDANPSIWDIPKVWNERHGDKLMIYPKGEIAEDIKKMYQLYLDEKNQGVRDE